MMRAAVGSLGRGAADFGKYILIVKKNLDFYPKNALGIAQDLT